MSHKEQIKNFEKIVPDAYHGTTIQVAQRIEESNQFEVSRGDHHYLGDGVYFYEASDWHATEWCKRVHPDSEHCVFCATINLGACLELANKDHRELLRRTAMKLRLKGKKDVTDAFVINFFATKIQKIDTVRMAYIVENKRYGKLYDGSRISDFYQLIICVRETDCILDFRRYSN